MSAVVQPSVAPTEIPSLPMYLAEKYSLKQASSGRWYLSPLATFLEYVAGTKASNGQPVTHGAAARAAEYGFGLVYPNGEDGKTTEAQRVNEMVEEANAFLLSLQAFSDNEAKAFERFLIDRATRNAVYAAITQFELENWASRARARGQNASEHENYGEKESRLQSFALAAGVSLAIVRYVLPTQSMEADVFDKAASRIVYENANYESSRLFTPSTSDQMAQAALDSAKLTARRF